MEKKRNIKPKFEVHKIEGKAMRNVATPKFDPEKKDKDGNPKLLGGFDYEDIEVDAGWMVYFPSGSSIHVWTQEEMERQGFLTPPGLVDMDTGDSVALTQPVSLKQHSERKTHRTRSSKAAQI